MTTLLLDSHTLRWWSAEPGRLSPRAVAAIEEGDDLAVSAISWFDLGWLAERQRFR